jgi:hypothetical protein
MHHSFSRLLRKLLPFTLCVACSAQGIPMLSRNSQSVIADQLRREAVQLQDQEYVLPQLVIGGEWSSTMKFTNRGTRQINSIPVYLVDSTGRPMVTTFQLSNGSTITDSSFTITIPVGSIIENTFVGGRDTQFGYAFIGCPDTGECETPGLYGEVALKNRNSTRPDFESVFPVEQPFSTQYLLFDGRNGFTTLLYLVNAGMTETVASLEIVDTSNRILRTVNLTFRPQETQLQTLHVLAAETNGIQGTLVLRAQNSDAELVATGLRINPSNSFTPIRAFVPPR